jgi:hypothetical protein
VARGNLVDPAGGRLGGVGAMSKLGWFVFQGVIIGFVVWATHVESIKTGTPANPLAVGAVGVVLAAFMTALVSRVADSLRSRRSRLAAEQSAGKQTSLIVPACRQAPKALDAVWSQKKLG